MSEGPTIVQRAATPYVALAADVTLENIGEIVPPLTQQVHAWLRSRDLAPAGAPFWKYNVIDMGRGMQVEAGFPTATPVAGDEVVHAGTLPAGRYATLRHIGHPSTLFDATARLLTWGDEHGLRWDVSPSAAVERWGCRLEIYYSEPDQDMNEWETELAFRLAG